MNGADRERAENSWPEYRRLVLAELETLGKRADSHSKELQELRSDIAMLKVRSGLWGATAGAIPGVIGFLFWFAGSG